MKSLFKDKKGEGYIKVVVATIFLVMLLTLVILFISLVSSVKMQKRDIKEKLSSYISSYSRDAFNSLKQGDNYLDNFDFLSFEKDLYSYLELENERDYTYPFTNLKMQLKNVEITKENGYGVKIEYVLMLDVVWNGKDYGFANVPISVSSSLNFKS